MIRNSSQAQPCQSLQPLPKILLSIIATSTTTRFHLDQTSRGWKMAWIQDQEHRPTTLDSRPSLNRTMTSTMKAPDQHRLLCLGRALLPSGVERERPGYCPVAPTRVQEETTTMRTFQLFYPQRPQLPFLSPCSDVRFWKRTSYQSTCPYQSRDCPSLYQRCRVLPIQSSLVKDLTIFNSDRNIGMI